MEEGRIKRLRLPHPDQERVDARAAKLLRRSARLLRGVVRIGPEGDSQRPKQRPAVEREADLDAAGGSNPSGD